MLFFHEEPEPRNYVVTRCASGPRIREGLHGESVCEPTLLRFIPSPSLITTKAYLYIYMSSIHEESAGLRPYYSSNSIEEKVEREKRKRAMHVRHTLIIEISRSIEHERHDGCLCKSTWTSNCRGVKKNGCRNVTYSTSIYIYIYTTTTTSPFSGSATAQRS